MSNAPTKPITLFITGTGTGVGKTVLAELLVKRLRVCGHAVCAFKPICSGGRADAEILWRAQGRTVPMEVVNPWWFRKPIAPFVAAREVGQRVLLSAVRTHIVRHWGNSRIVVIEGAGGLLSPLGEGFSSRELLVAMRAVPLIVAANRLGMLNEILLTWEALPVSERRRAQVVVFATSNPDESSTTNVPILRELLPPERIHVLPHGLVSQGFRLRGPAKRTVDTLLAAIGIDHQ